MQFLYQDSGIPVRCGIWVLSYLRAKMILEVSNCRKLRWRYPKVAIGHSGGHYTRRKGVCAGHSGVCQKDPQLSLRLHCLIGSYLACAFPDNSKMLLHQVLGGTYLMPF